MLKALIIAVLLGSGFYGLVTVHTAQVPALAICTGGVFQGPIEPTRPPEVGDPRNCRAFPTKSRNNIGHGPIPLSWASQLAKSSQPPQLRRSSVRALFDITHRPGFVRAAASRARHANYHFAGTTTNQFAYQALGGFLQVRNPDLSQSGGHVIGTYLWTPDYSYLYQVGWIDEGYIGDEDATNYPRVFAESNLPGGCCRYYFDQYPLTVGTKYNFWTVSKPAGKHGLLWWNGTWNELHPVTSSVTREGVMQQFLEVFSQTLTHPTVQTMSNHSSELVYQDTIIQWDASISTQELESSPYQTTVVEQYHNWQAGS
jgi:hypothetical protein